MKQCSKCKVVKAKNEFYSDKRTPDGLKCQCKKCHTQTTIKTRNVENARDKNREFMRKARKRDPEKFRTRERKYKRIKNERYEARVILNTAVASGKITRPAICQDCGEKKRITAHHNDYSKPLDVEWLCYQCHGKRHRKIL